MADVSGVFATISFENINASLVSIQRMVTAASYIIGISFGVKALYSMKKLAQEKAQMSDHGSVKEPLMYFLVAGMCIYLPSAVEVIMNSTFGYSQVLAYAPIDSGSSTLNTLFGAGSVFGYTLTLFIQVVGVVAFIRGWMLIARSASSGQPPGGTGTGLMHVFGGILAMNIVGTLQVINNTIFGV